MKASRCHCIRVFEEGCQMKKTIALFLAMLIGLSPVISLADVGYLLLKTLMEDQIVEDVEVPTGMSTPLGDASADYIVAYISLNRNWIAIQGYDAAEKLDSRMYHDLEAKQLYLYAMAILLMFESIDDATSRDFYVLVSYGNADDERVIISDKDTAEDIYNILYEAAKQL